MDLGSNAIRLVVGERRGSGFAVLESERLPVRLGQDVFGPGVVPDKVVAALVGAFTRFRAMCDDLAVAKVRAIATAAMREAKNRDHVVAEVRRATGFEIEVISGMQEAGLLTRAVQQQVDLDRGRSVLVDVGGGSVEVVLVHRGTVEAADSHPIGSVRLLSVLRDAPKGASAVEVLRRSLQAVEPQIRQRLGGQPVDRYVGVGGSIENLTDLVATEAAARGGTESVALAAVRAETDALASLSVAQRVAHKGLTHDRADTIVPAGVIYLRIGELAGVDRIYVPRVGIKEGLLAAMVAEEV